MTHPPGSPLARVLAAPWQHRRNVGSLWGAVFVVAACAAFPVVLFALSVLGDPAQADAMRRQAGLSAWIGVCALLAAGWAMLVGNLLRQNHPALARLVPGHAGHLRTALLVAWALLVLLAAGGPGFAFGAPLAWACGAAAALATFAAALRWPVLWLGGVVAPFVSAALVHGHRHAALGAALRAQWQGAGWLVAAIVFTAGGVVLAAIVRQGDARHAVAYERWARGRAAASQGGPTGSGGAMAAATCMGGVLGGLARPYQAWLRRLLARPDSAVMARVSLGLGPATHWTTRLFEAGCALLFSAVLAAVAVPFMDAEARATACAYGAMFVLLLLSPPAVQHLQRLWHTRREQALLALLPGVPRGAALNRWLGWRMSGPFLLTALVALALARALAALGESIRPGVLQDALGGMVDGFAVALLPLIALQWRGWARLRQPGSLETTGPVLLQMALVALAITLHGVARIGYGPLGAAFACPALGWCAWRWWRMGREPSALPVGRLA